MIRHASAPAMMKTTTPSPITAVILAAGMGTRLKDIHQNLPKGLLKIDDKELMLRSLEALTRQGIQEIVLVTGYRAEAYHAALQADYPTLRFVHNDVFASTGSMHSLFLAEKTLSSDLLLLESDLLYEDRCLTALLSLERPDAVLLSGTTHSGDEVYVYGENGRIHRISKEPIPSLRCQGELVGISRLSLTLCRKMCAYYQRAIPPGRDFHYEDCLSDLAETEDIPYHRIDDLVWTEIDNADHYHRALELIYPRILAAGSPI
jgi:2-aminoethylphosphonate-pyruvate transaminase